MTSLRLSIIVIFAAFFCVANSDPLLSLFGKSDDKTEADEKTTVSTASTAKAVGEETATTTTSSPGTSCGGLKGFLHICDKNEPEEQPKSVKTRSVKEKDSDEDSDESKSDDDDDDDSDDSSDVKEKKQNATETSPVSESTSEGGKAKRQVGDPDAPILGEVPPVIADAMERPTGSVESSEDDKQQDKRQVNDSDSSSDEDETEENFRRRRDCRDRDGDNDKDCRRKREFVPSCSGLNCKNNTTDETNA